MDDRTLSDLPFVERFFSVPETASTNDLARSAAELPQKGILVFQADRQTCGRGRTGASFFSSTDSGLWVSILARVAALDEHFIHNRALSLAIAEAAESVCRGGVTCRIKWPNDIFISRRKVCGILLENHQARGDLLVLGFGINVTTMSTDFPEELQAIATSIFIEYGQQCSRSSLLHEIIERYWNNLALDPASAHAVYSRRLYRVGDRATIDNATGIFEGVEPEGLLRLLCNDGVRYFLSGHLRFADEPGSAPANG